MREVELQAEVGNGLLDEVVELDVEDVRDDEAENQVPGDPEDAVAELFEMLHEAHAGKFGAVLYGGACALG